MGGSATASSQEDQWKTRWTPEAIIALREQLGMSQMQFAVACGVHISTVTRWEQGTLPNARRAGIMLDRLAMKVKTGGK